MPGLQVPWLPVVSPAGPARPLPTLVFMTGNVLPPRHPFQSYPPSSMAPSSRKPAFIDDNWLQLFLLHVGPSQHACTGAPGSPWSSCPCLAPTASYVAPKMHSRALGTQAGIHFVPGRSREFLSSFPAEYGPGTAVGMCLVVWAWLACPGHFSQGA